MTFSFSLGAQSQLKGDELKNKLLECLQTKSSHLSVMVNAFYEKNVSYSEQDYIKLCKEIIGCIDEILNNDHWEDSLFIRNSLKPLKNLREKALTLLEQVAPSLSMEVESESPITEDRVLLYISLYQQDGSNIKKWELQLKSIECYLAGRPVYQKEEEVKKMIRLKLAQTSEAYIITAAKKSAIQNDVFHPQRLDRCGNPLVSVAAGAITEKDILEFIHQDQRYRFIDGKLIPKNLSQ